MAVVSIADALVRLSRLASPFTHCSTCRNPVRRERTKGWRGHHRWCQRHGQAPDARERDAQLTPSRRFPAQRAGTFRAS